MGFKLPRPDEHTFRTTLPKDRGKSATVETAFDLLDLMELEVKTLAAFFDVPPSQTPTATEIRMRINEMQRGHSKHILQEMFLTRPLPQIEGYGPAYVRNPDHEEDPNPKAVYHTQPIPETDPFKRPVSSPSAAKRAKLRAKRKRK
jgi:hypothetical protein